MSPFTINTFFPTGDPSGFRISTVPTQPIMAFYIPREAIKAVVGERKELKWNGVYTLFNELGDGIRRTAYIGEAEDVGHRLLQHNVPGEDWWDFGVAFVWNNADQQLSKADIKYLEHMMYQQAVTSDTMDLQNGNTPHESFVSEARTFDLQVVFENIDLLLRSFGLPLFYQAPNDNRVRLLYFTGRESDATAVYTSEGMTVRKGSRLSPLSPSKTFGDGSRLAGLQKKGIIQNDTFTKDYTFESPSGAGRIIYKARCNGWTMWHDQNGQTLADLYR